MHAEKCYDAKRQEPVNAARKTGARSGPEAEPRALLGQLARLGQYDLGLPLVIADLSRHADAFADE